MSEADKSQSTEVVEKTRMQKAMETVTRNARKAMTIALVCATPACANSEVMKGARSPHDAIVAAREAQYDVARSQAQPASPEKSAKGHIDQVISMNKIKNK